MKIVKFISFVIFAAFIAETLGGSTSHPASPNCSLRSGALGMLTLCTVGSLACDSIFSLNGDCKTLSGAYASATPGDGYSCIVYSGAGCTGDQFAVSTQVNLPFAPLTFNCAFDCV